MSSLPTHKNVNGIDVPLTEDEIIEIKASWDQYENVERPLQEVYQKRIEAYGSVVEQLDYITKYGIDEFRAKNLAIKEQFPLPTKVVK